MKFQTFLCLQYLFFPRRNKLEAPPGFLWPDTGSGRGEAVICQSDVDRCTGGRGERPGKVSRPGMWIDGWKRNAQRAVWALKWEQRFLWSKTLQRKDLIVWERQRERKRGGDKAQRMHSLRLIGITGLIWCTLQDPSLRHMALYLIIPGL